MLKSLLSLICVVVMLAPLGLVQAEEKGGRKPPSRVTEKLSQAVFEKIQQAQAALEADDLARAESILLALKGGKQKRNDYELSQIHNFLAAVHYEQGLLDQTISDYISILKLANAPEQLRNNALFRLAQMYFMKEDYARSIKALDKWMEWVESVRPEAYMLKAQAYYQLENYAESEAAILAALKEGYQRKQHPRESWFGLLRAVYYQQGQYDKAVKVLKQMIKRWPSASYYKQLSGMLGLAGEQKPQLYVMHAAAAKDMLVSESDLLNLARLYMAEEAPFAAVELLKQGMRDGQLSQSVENLELLAQAMSLAKDDEGQIPVLAKAAKQANSAKLYLYLGQAHAAAYQWREAAESLAQAIAIDKTANADSKKLDRIGSVYMQLGTAQFNLKNYNLAIQAFKDASAYDDYTDQADNWLRFVQQEVQRQQALSAAAS